MRMTGVSLAMIHSPPARDAAKPAGAAEARRQPAAEAGPAGGRRRARLGRRDDHLVALGQAAGDLRHLVVADAALDDARLDLAARRQHVHDLIAALAADG